MKKIVFFAALAALAAVSCVKEGYDTDVQPTVIKATIAETETKTVLENGTKTYWAPGDKLSVFNAGKGNCRFDTDITEKSASADFTYPGGAEYFDEPAVWWAFYPYNSAIETADFATFTGLELPVVQIAVAGGFDPAAALAYGKGASADLKFNNLTALVKFTVAADNVYNVKLVSTGDKLAGTASFDGTKLTATEDAVQLKGAMSEGKTYYVAVAPGTFSTLKVYVNGVELTTKSYTNKTLKAGTIYNMGEITNPNTLEVVNSYTVAATTSTITESDITVDHATVTDYSASNPFQNGWAWIGQGYMVYDVAADGNTMRSKENQPYSEFVTIPDDQKTSKGHFYAVLYQFYGLVMYFNIDWESTYGGTANVYPLLDIQDRAGQHNKLVVNHSYYDANNNTLVIDVALKEGSDIKLIHAAFTPRS